MELSHLSPQLTISRSGVTTLVSRKETWLGRVIQKLGDKVLGRKRFDSTMLTEEKITEVAHDLIKGLRKNNTEAYLKRVSSNLDTFTVTTKKLLDKKNIATSKSIQQIETLVKKIGKIKRPEVRENLLEIEVDVLSEKLQLAIDTYKDLDKSKKAHEEFKKVALKLHSEINTVIGLKGATALSRQSNLGNEDVSRSYKNFLKKYVDFTDLETRLDIEPLTFSRKLRLIKEKYQKSETKSEKVKSEFKKQSSKLLEELNRDVGKKGITALWNGVSSGDDGVKEKLQLILELYAELHMHTEKKSVDISEAPIEQSRQFIDHLLSVNPPNLGFDYPQYLLDQLSYSNTEEQLKKNEKLLKKPFSISGKPDEVYDNIIGEQFKDPQTGEINTNSLRQGFVQDCHRQFPPSDTESTKRKSTYIQGEEILREHLISKEVAVSELYEKDVHTASTQGVLETEEKYVIADNFESQITKYTGNKELSQQIMLFLQQGSRSLEESHIRALFTNFLQNPSDCLLIRGEIENTRAININEEIGQVVITMNSKRPLVNPEDKSFKYYVEINTGITLSTDDKQNVPLSHFTSTYTLMEIEENK